MKKLMQSVLALTMVIAMLAAGSLSAFAAKGNGNGARDRIRDNTCGNVCIYDGECPYDCDGTRPQDGSCGNCPYDGECPYGCDGTRPQDGSCGDCPYDGECPNNREPLKDGSGGGNAKGWRNRV